MSASNRQKFIVIYDEFRTMVLNKEYYSVRVSRSRRILRVLDIFLAVFASGSGVLSFAFWKAEAFGLPVGPMLLSLATGVALVMGIARPYLKLEDELERLSGIQGAYGSIAYAMEDVVTKIKTNEAVDPTSEAIYQTLRNVRGYLIQREDTPSDKVLIEELQAIVNKRYPMDTYFYYPKEDEAG